ncbi:3-hydroxyacyl-CoA dehydrogenase [Vandammella animalimorsus]|uniref:3-hydroxyacyl-CoA dehydrogenase n=1 Tax=Vandammella animalimorsus TaxID=2029117 RepID=A0A3M6RQA1_9BURK|nr:3-hydroxyacyl-CoA dehydrogenase NAD-binding domain-containing protein [Vandammella animalimorsus]RMX17533.1 3-hydroxyacyl-CoA dehydrogenase [Vandammella animalimorsus]
MSDHVSCPPPNAAAPLLRQQHGPVLALQLQRAPTLADQAVVCAALQQALQQAQDDAATQAVLLLAGPAWDGALDAAAVQGDAARTPDGQALRAACQGIEAFPKPVIAVLQQRVQGAGLELALAAHYRLALPSARLAWADWALGLPPAAGGMARALRWMGAEAAATWLLGGKALTAQQARDAGLVDQLLADGDDALAAGLAWAGQLLAQQAGPRPASAQPLASPEQALAELDAQEQAQRKSSRGLQTPTLILQALRAAVQQPWAQALAAQQAVFEQGRGSAQHAALLHAAWAERAAAQVPEARAAAPRPVQRIGVVGGGTMGAGIAVAALNAGLPVTMIERDAQALARGQANVEKVYDGLIAKGRMSEQAKAATMARFAASTDYAALAEVDLVIEAVFEDLAVKQAVFAELERVCKPGAVLATNTSYLDIDAIAAATGRPQDVIGLHFFSPAHIMKLLEIVVPAQAAPDVVATAFALAARMQKTPVRAGVCDGFIGNRILAVYKQAADYLMEDGASPYEIDAAVRGFGYPMGPFQVTDLAGGDIGWATRKRRAATRDPRARYVEIADRICERGWFGQKTGRGFYRYADGARSGQPDEEVLAIAAAERARKGITPRSFSADEIMRRYMAAMVNEGAKVVQEGIALRPLDVDAVFLGGYGFPRWRGGPMHWADAQGLQTILADIQAFAQEDALFWQPAELLQQLVAQGRNFASLNAAAATTEEQSA